jgi:glycosyltransferase involved in cell wall biosynthesis
MHILILGNDPKTLVNFRGPLIEAMVGAGHRVTAAASGCEGNLAPWFVQRGVAYFNVPIERAGLNPLTDWRMFSRLVLLMRELKPDLAFASAIKPVVYGLIAARVAGVARRAAMITGLGYSFTDNPGDGLAQRAKRLAVRAAARGAYGLALRFADTVIFQNPDDRDAFAAMGLTRATQHVGVVNGSGVDLKHFSPAPMPNGSVTFLMIARLLRDKGVYEYVEAARLVKREKPDARFVLVGPFDPNPAAVKPHEVEAWVREGLIEYRGAVDDVRPQIAACHVFVLPSYREGTPRTVLEAMAMGRPVITTDVPGCRETLVDGANGLLVPARDPSALADAARTLATDAELRGKMAARSLDIVRQRFASDQVSAAILSALIRRAKLGTSEPATSALPSSADRSNAAASAP